MSTANQLESSSTELGETKVQQTLHQEILRSVVKILKFFELFRALVENYSIPCMKKPLTVPNIAIYPFYVYIEFSIN